MQKKAKGDWDLATEQISYLLAKHSGYEIELDSLRKAVQNLQIQGEEKDIIAKQHQHIAALQLAELSALQKSEIARANLRRTEAQLVVVSQVG
jgi:hypothetical protein